MSAGPVVVPGGRGAPRKALDIEKVRADFPILGQEIYGKPLVYLDNAATTQKPRAVLEAIDRFYREECSNVHRGVHLLSHRATQAYEEARSTVAGMLGAEDREIVMVRGTTEAINLVAQSYVRPRLSRGDEILVTAMEHHSNIVPWQLVCDVTGAELRVAPINDEGEVILEEYEKLLGPRTRFVSIIHISNALGTVNPVRKMTTLAHERNVPVLVDGAQAVPHMAVDVAEIDCDFYCFSAHKVYGPTGIGALYGRAAVLEAMTPYQGGGDMIASVSFEKTTYNSIPFRFEAGTPNIAGAIGMAAALDYVKGLGFDAILAHEKELLEYATAKVREIPGLRIIGTAREKASVLSFVMDGIHPHDIGTILDQEGIAVRTGHHCAEPVMKRFAVPATARASFSLYNTRQEVDALVAALGKVAEVFA